MTRNEWINYLTPYFVDSDYDIVPNHNDGDKSIHIHKKGTTKPQVIEIWCGDKTSIVLSKELKEIVEKQITLKDPADKVKGNKFHYRGVADSLVINVCNILLGNRIII